MPILQRIVKSVKRVSAVKRVRSFHFWANCIVIALILFIAFAGLLNIDPSWDSQEYHLPFAARLAGIFTKDEFRMRKMVEGYFDGIAKLAELAQGVLWRVTGLPGAANLVGLFSLVILIGVSSFLFKIPLWQLTLYYLSIPLVLRHTYSAYVDLATNAFLALAVLVFFYSILNKKFTIKLFVLTLVPLTISANIKLYGLVISGLLLVIILSFYIFSLIKNRMHAKAYFKYFLILLAFVGLAYWSILYDFIQFGNPIYPMAFSLGARNFPGIASASTYTHIANAFSVPKSNPYYFFRSLSELDLWKVRPKVLYTIDMNLGHFHPILSAKMGGFFVGNLILWGLGIVLSLIGTRNKRMITCLMVLFTLTLASSFLPSASELRYVMFIPLTLSTLLLIGINRRSTKSIMRVIIMLIQLAIFVFVGYQVVAKDYFPEALTLKQYQQSVLDQKLKYDINVDSPICIYGDFPEAFYYKLQNPELVIEFVPKQDDCNIENKISILELEQYRTNK
ncbi:MAG: hypothetical protein MUO40_13140 [Anaerolineaceae bacterium]|nr:hypothetical protein [Anaerolineaceae bacterium]